MFACQASPPISDDTGEPGEPETDGASDTGAPTGTNAAGETDAASETDAANETDAASETDAANETDTTAGETDTEAFPAGCEAPDPSVSAAFELVLEGWPDASSEEHDIEVECVVDAIEAGPTIVNHLLCDDGGQERAAVLRFAAPVLAEDYLAGDTVHLVSHAENWDDIGLGIMRRIELRAAVDGRLLVAGLRKETLDPAWFAPLTVEVELPCAPDGFVESPRPDEGPPQPMRLDFGLPDGPVLGLIGGHSGLLDGGAGFAYDIDVETASTNNCCHFTRFHVVLARRVVVDG